MNDRWRGDLERMDGKHACERCQTDQERQGDGNVVRSSYEVNFPAFVKGQKLSITAAVVPGSAPFLVARPALEEWKVKPDYEKHSSKSWSLIGLSPSTKRRNTTS